MEEAGHETEELVRAAANSDSAEFKRIKELVAASIKRRPGRSTLDAKRVCGADATADGKGLGVREGLSKPSAG